jgi:hypothetical protein
MRVVGRHARRAVLATLLAVAVGAGPLAVHLASTAMGATTPTAAAAHHLHAIASLPACEPTDHDPDHGGPPCAWCTLARWLPPACSDAVAVDLQVPRAAPASEPILLRDPVATGVRSRAPPSTT